MLKVLFMTKVMDFSDSIKNSCYVKHKEKYRH